MEVWLVGILENMFTVPKSGRRRLANLTVLIMGVYYKILINPQGNMHKNVPCSIIWGHMKSDTIWVPIPKTWIEKMR